MGKVEQFSLEMRKRITKRVEALAIANIDQITKSYLSLCESEIEKLFLLAWLEQLEINKINYLDNFVPYKYFIVEGNSDIDKIMSEKIQETIKDNKGKYYFDFVFPQFIIENYRLDFLLTRVVQDNGNLSLIYKTAIECDGHDFHEKTKEQAQKDKARDRYLQYRDIQVLRFTGSEIYNRPRECIKEIFEQVNKLSNKEKVNYLTEEEIKEPNQVIIDESSHTDEKLNFKFSNLKSLAFDKQGNLYVIDGKYLIKFSTSGEVYFSSNNTWVESNKNLNSQFTNLIDIAIDSEDNIYVTEPHLIKKIKPSGVVQVLINDDTLKPAFENIFITELNEIIITEGAYICCLNNEQDKILVLYKKPIEGTIRGTKDDFRKFRSVHGISTDEDGNIYATEYHRIIKIAPDKSFSVVAGSLEPGLIDGKGSSAKFNYPHGIVVDDSGNIIVADSGNNRICKVSPEGNVETIAGTTKGFEDGVGLDAKFDKPFNLKIDNEGNVYIIDIGNNAIRKLYPEGFILTL